MKTIQNELVLTFKRGDGKNQILRIPDCREDLENNAILEAAAGILSSGVLCYDQSPLLSLHSAVRVRTEKEAITF